MGTRDKRIDAYIAKAAEFARPILTEIRARVHASCPEVVETIKWGMPSFEHHGPFIGMAAFKAHCTLGFWKHDLVVGAEGKSKQAMGSFGRLTELSQLPTKAQFARYVKKAMALNEQGVKAERKKMRPATPAKLHPEFAAALKKNAGARATLDGFPPGQRREYVEWIAEAKRDETRARRIEQAIVWLAEGKRRNWKYERC